MSFFLTLRRVFSSGCAIGLSPPQLPTGRLRLSGHLFCLGLATLFPGPSSAQSFSTLLDLARQGEPTYLSAKANLQAAKARTEQALGALLPQLSASGNTNANDRQYQTRNSTAPAAKDGYNSNAAQVSLTQPIWRYANIVGWQQAKAVVLQAEHQLLGAEQELFARVVSAWFDVLAARDGVVFTAQQGLALRRQWEIAQRGAEIGAYGQPQVDEARAKLDQALSDAVTAETDAHLKKAALEQLVGPFREQDLPYVNGTAVLSNPTAVTLEKWLEAVEEGNPNILSAVQAFAAGGAEVRKQRAGHYPTLDMVASYGKNSQAVGGFPGQAGYDITQGSVGLQLNIPLFSGGTQSAKVDEALAQKEKARLDIEAARRSAILAGKQAWFGWQGAYARAQAGSQAIVAARSALAAARRGVDQGLKTELDLLQAEQQLRAAQRDFRKGRYDQIAADIKLKAAAGKLTDSDMAALDALLVTSPEEADPVLDAPAIKVSRK